MGAGPGEGSGERAMAGRTGQGRQDKQQDIIMRLRTPNLQTYCRPAADLGRKEITQCMVL